MNKGLFCFLLLALIPLGCYRIPSLDQRIQQMVEAHNRHDVTLELSFYAEDATFIIPGEKPIVGKAALRDLFESDAVWNSELALKDLVIRGDTVTSSGTERNDFFRSMGIPEIHYAPGGKIVFRKGLIQRVETGLLEKEDSMAFEKAWSDVMAWLSVAHPELVKEAESGWLARYNARAAQDWMKLLAEWQASKSHPKK